MSAILEKIAKQTETGLASTVQDLLNDGPASNIF
jgi:hypothetical protein